MKAKRSLGQNFLHSRGVARELVSALGVGEMDVVLEIGPGKGIITEELLLCAKKVIAVEKDDALVEYLKEKFKAEISSEKLHIVHVDILDFDPLSSRGYSPLTAGTVPHQLLSTNYLLIGAIPYNITGLLFKHFLQNIMQPKAVAFIVQKEVAERVVAKDKKESLLSLSVKAYGLPRYVKTVHAKNFNPSPSVNSAILEIHSISKKFFKEKNIDEHKFFEFVRAGFSSKRKKLLSNLSTYIEQRESNNSRFNSRDLINECFKKAGVDENVRAEDLSLATWRALYIFLSHKHN